MWNDIHDLLSNYYSLYDEVEKNQDLGIVLFNEKPALEPEMKWFTNLYTDTKKGNAVVLVAEDGGAVVGICGVHRLRPGSEADHTGMLGISIREEFRNREIGKALIAGIIDACSGKFTIPRLTVFTVNERALSLYKKMGFGECGTIPKTV